MKKINLVFDCDFDDVDILLVPDDIADNMDEVIRRFNRWLHNPQNRQRFLVPYQGKMELGIDTGAFLWWLNTHEISNGAAATIIQQHTAFCPNYPTADL